MQPALPINIQSAKIATGKMPAAIGGKLGAAQVPGQAGATQDFSNILSMLTGKGAATEGKLGQDVIKGLLEGDTASAELSPEQAAELKANALLSSKKAAQFTLFGDNTEALITDTPAEGVEGKVPQKNLGAEKKLVSAMKVESAENTDLEKILGTKNEKSVVALNPKMIDAHSKVEGENLVKKDGMKATMPVHKGEVAIADSNELLNLRQAPKNSKGLASKEYSKAHNPFESNVIQLKKESKLEKESSKLEQETMKPLELLARESSGAVQNIQREPQQMSIALGGAHQTAKALDLTNVNNSAEIVNKIVNYLEQSNIQNRENLEVAVKHETLGQFNVNVHRASKGEDVSIQILTNTEAGHDFFVKNESLLNKALVDAGVKVADLRFGSLSTENMMGGKQNTDSGFSGNFSGHDQNGQRYYSERQQSQDSDSRRRQELWEQYRERSLA